LAAGAGAGKLGLVALADIIHCAPFRLTTPRALSGYEWTVVRQALRSGYAQAGVFAMTPAARAEIETLLATLANQTACPGWRQSAFGPAPAVAPFAYECLGAWYARLDPASKARALADIAHGLLCQPNPPWASCPHARALGPRDLWEGAVQRGELAPGVEPCALPRQRISYVPMRGTELLALFRLAGGQLPPQLAEAARFGGAFLERDFLVGVEAKPPDPAVLGQLARSVDLLAIARALVQDVALVWAPGKGASVRFLLDQPLDGSKIIALVTVMLPDLLPSMLPTLLPQLIPPPNDPLWGTLFGTLGQVLGPRPAPLRGFGQAEPGTPPTTGVAVIDRPGSELPTDPPPIRGLKPTSSSFVIGIGAAVLAVGLLAVYWKGRSS
jgi:hypothetical protein